VRGIGAQCQQSRHGGSVGSAGCGAVAISTASDWRGLRDWFNGRSELAAARIGKKARGRGSIARACRGPRNLREFCWSSVHAGSDLHGNAAARRKLGCGRDNAQLRSAMADRRV
jgi:hypothetical protein